MTKLQLSWVVTLLLACGDGASTEAGGGADTGPAGPGVGPGPTTGTGASGAGESGGGGTAGSGAGGGLDCFEDPMVHVEIINACTDALAIDKVEQIPGWDEGDPLPALP